MQAVQTSDQPQDRIRLGKDAASRNLQDRQRPKRQIGFDPREIVGLDPIVVEGDASDHKCQPHFLAAASGEIEIGELVG